LKKHESTKIQFTMFFFVFFCFWYHGFNGNIIYVPKEINSILIGAHLHIPNIYTSRKKNWNLKEKKNNNNNNYVKDLWEYDSILTIQNTWLKFDYDFWWNNFTYKFIIWYYTIYWIIIDNFRWNSIEPFYFNGTKKLTTKIFIPRSMLFCNIVAKKMTSLCSWECCKIKI
jgi:hypothetical protein